MTKDQINVLNQESDRAREQARQETAQLIVPQVPSKRTNMFLNMFALVFFVAGLFLMIYTSYLYFWPFHPLVVRSVAVTTPVVKSPGSLTYQIDACKNTTLTPIVYRKVVEGNIGASLPQSQGLATKGCRVTKVSIPIPSGIRPGDHYILYSDIAYPINRLRVVHVLWHSQPFRIVN